MNEWLNGLYSQKQKHIQSYRRLYYNENKYWIKYVWNTNDCDIIL